MLFEFIHSLWLIFPITLVTMVLEALAFPRMPNSGKSSLAGTMVGFLLFGLGFGFLAIVIYHWVGSRWVVNPDQIFLWLALGAAIIFTILGIAMHFIIKIPWLVVALWAVMNFLWAAAYGLYLPGNITSLANPI